VTLSNGQERMLLTDCFGYAKPGIAVALMGASPAGKSTLLDVLAGKKTTGTVTGDISLNGKPFEAKSFNHLAAYGDFDAHNALSTVKEAITFSALLRLPTHITSKEGTALRLSNSVANLINRAGTLIVPTQQGAIYAAVELGTQPRARTTSPMDLTDASSTSAWPIVTMSFLLIDTQFSRGSCKVRTAVVEFWLWYLGKMVRSCWTS
jgi:ATP-binding cassette subfamily G (WHITE) protein 2 (PDR)